MWLECREDEKCNVRFSFQRKKNRGSHWWEALKRSRKRSWEGQDCQSQRKKRFQQGDKTDVAKTSKEAQDLKMLWTSWERRDDTLCMCHPPKNAQALDPCSSHFAYPCPGAHERIFVVWQKPCLEGFYLFSKTSLTSYLSSILTVTPLLTPLTWHGSAMKPR